MRLYQAKVINTCPRRVTIYMAEKEIECDVVTVDMRAGAGRTPEFLRMNPAGTVPVLELDDGSFLPESAAIIEYLEELYPAPPMLGESSEERARIRAAERIITDFQSRFGIWSGNSHPSWPKRRPEMVQFPEVADYIVPARDMGVRALEALIGDNEFLVGNRPSIADCALFALIDTSNRLTDYEFPDTAPRLRGWFNRFRERQSAQYPDWAVERAAKALT